MNATTPKGLPKQIWLQRCEKSADCDYPECNCEITWCEDKINDSDIRYVKDKRYRGTMR